MVTTVDGVLVDDNNRMVARFHDREYDDVYDHDRRQRDKNAADRRARAELAAATVALAELANVDRHAQAGRAWFRLARRPIQRKPAGLARHATFPQAVSHSKGVEGQTANFNFSQHFLFHFFHQPLAYQAVISGVGV